MRFKRAFLLFPLAILITLLAGCIYVRLLEVKLQLTDFEKYFKIENGKGLSLVFFKPVLSSQDILAMAKRGPTSGEGDAQQMVWQYHFIKQYPHPEPEKAAYDVPVSLVFRENKLCTGTLPERFYEILPREFIIDAFKAVGRAEVNMIERSAKGSFFERDKEKGGALPKSADIERLLGKPFSEEKSGEVTVRTFVYRLQKNSLDTAPPINAWARFTFIQESEELRKIEAKFAGMRVTLHFDGTAQ